MSTSEKVKKGHKFFFEVDKRDTISRHNATLKAFSVNQISMSNSSPIMFLCLKKKAVF